MTNIVDEFDFGKRTSDFIKENGPSQLFQELEARCLVDVENRSISNLRPLVKRITNEESSFLKTEFSILLEEFCDTEIDNDKEDPPTGARGVDSTSPQLNETTDAAPMVFLIKCSGSSTLA